MFIIGVIWTGRVHRILNQKNCGLMVMALDYGAGGREFKPCHFQNIFDLMERFDESVWQRRRNGLTN